MGSRWMSLNSRIGEGTFVRNDFFMIKAVAVAIVIVITVAVAIAVTVRSSLLRLHFSFKSKYLKDD